ncbi:MAG: T9SS type A sorting domain-containing protein, partial [Saprospiraceae bacterium]|nr:T9SS type A sorting domain-containing protein [Saprospiraceae bacterium]
ATENELHTSSDFGQTWSLTSTFDTTSSALCVGGDGNYYLALDNGLIQQSTDGGSTWSAWANFDQGVPITMVFKDDQNALLRASTTMYATQDGGLTWTEKGRPYNGTRLYRADGDWTFCIGTNGSDSDLYYNQDYSVDFPDRFASCAGVSQYAAYDPINNIFWTVAHGMVIEKVGFSPSFINNQSPIPEALSFFPNPATETITLDAGAERGTLFVQDVNGRELLQKNVFEQNPNISLEPLTRGIYILRFIQENGEIRMGKMIKQ